MIPRVSSTNTTPNSSLLRASREPLSNTELLRLFTRGKSARVHRKDGHVEEFPQLADPPSWPQDLLGSASSEATIKLDILPVALVEHKKQL